MSETPKARQIRGILCCPKCRGELSPEGATCLTCRASFVRTGDQLRFSDLWQSDKPANGDSLNSWKEAVKSRAAWLYPFLLEVLSPVYASMTLSRFVKSFAPDKVIVNLGAGTSRVSPKVINFDLAPYKTVDVVADLQHLPVKSQSIDLILNIAVLEHVPDPQSVVAEFHRTLKPDGKVLCYVPFMQGFHASPYDFQRYTSEGLKVLFRDFDIHWITPSGPTSGMLWLLQEWLAMVLSLGSLKLYRMLVPIMWVLSPLKYMDVLLRHHPAAGQITSGFFLLASPRSTRAAESRS